MLGDAYGGDIGEEVSRLVVVLAPWMVASVGVNVSFPLAFVAERLRAAARGSAPPRSRCRCCSRGSDLELLELDGLAVALALSTLLVLAALLAQLGALERGLRGIVRGGGRRRRRRRRRVRPARASCSAARRAALAGVLLYVVLVALVAAARAQGVVGYLRALR